MSKEELQNRVFALEAKVEKLEKIINYLEAKRWTSFPINQMNEEAQG